MINSFWKIVIYIGLPFSILGTISCLCILFHRTNNLGIDYLGIIVGIQSLLVTILIGWNIYQVINIKQEWERSKEYTIRLENDLKKSQEMLRKKQDAFKHYGYAITDFCQVYAKLEPKKEDYWSTYCKSLSSLKNFLKTEEDLDWYAPACINNMKDAIGKAEELKEPCNEQINRDIEQYVNEIRTCPINGFNNYWALIDELERKRKERLIKV